MNNTATFYPSFSKSYYFVTYQPASFSFVILFHTGKPSVTWAASWLQTCAVQHPSQWRPSFVTPTTRHCKSVDVKVTQLSSVMDAKRHPLSHLTCIALGMRRRQPRCCAIARHSSCHLSPFLHISSLPSLNTPPPPLLPPLCLSPGFLQRSIDPSGRV